MGAARKLEGGDMVIRLYPDARGSCVEDSDGIGGGGFIIRQMKRLKWIPLHLAIWCGIFYFSDYCWRLKLKREGWLSPEETKEWISPEQLEAARLRVQAAKRRHYYDGM